MAQGPNHSALPMLALLRANYYLGQDHIDMFLPIVTDVALGFSDGFNLGQLKQAIAVAYGLNIPEPTLTILLTRAVKRGRLTREGGLYFPTDTLQPNPQLAQWREEVGEEQKTIASALVAFAKERGNAVDPQRAVDLILAFLQEHQVTMLLGQDLSEGHQLQPRDRRLVAAFIKDRCLPEPRLRSGLQRLVEGLVLCSALFVHDLSTINRPFRDLTVFLDTRFVLHLLGLGYESNTAVATEALRLLREQGARLCVLRGTIREIEGIFRVYESRIGTKEGILSLHQTELTRYFLTKRFSTSQIRELSVTVESRLAGLGLSIREAPDRQTSFTTDEKELAKRLGEFEERSDHSPRVTHDVECVAAVMTLRQGHASERWEDARAVFATTTGLVVKNVSSWYRQSNAGGLPPATHVYALASIAWLKNPKTSANLQLQELVALCAVALRPSEAVWRAFLEHLRQAEAKQEVSSDEVVAILASSLVDSRLSEIDDDFQPDSVTIRDVIEHVKQSYQRQAWEHVSAAQRIASEERAKREARDDQLQRRVAAVARWTARAIYWGLVLLVVLSSVLGLPEGSNGSVLRRIVRYGVGLIILTLGIVGSLYGTTVREITERFERAVHRTLWRWLTGEKPVGPAAADDR